MPNPIDLDHIARLLAAATPTTCTTFIAEGAYGWYAALDPHDEVSREECETRANADAALIAALVTAAPAMVAELRRLRAELDDQVMMSAAHEDAIRRLGYQPSDGHPMAWLITSLAQAMRWVPATKELRAKRIRAIGLGDAIRAALGVSLDDEQLVEEIRRLRAENATAREEGRAEERAAVVRYLRWVAAGCRGEGGPRLEADGLIQRSEDIERGKHREEDDNA